MPPVVEEEVVVPPEAAVAQAPAVPLTAAARQV